MFTGGVEVAGDEVGGEIGPGDGNGSSVSSGNGNESGTEGVVPFQESEACNGSNEAQEEGNDPVVSERWRD